MNTNIIKLAIIDESPILSNGLLTMLQGYSHLEVLVAVTTTAELLYRIEQDPVDILLVDILTYARGDELGKKVKGQFPRVRILVLSMNNHEPRMAQYVLNDQHIDGFLSDNAGCLELVTALHKIISDGGYFSDDLPMITQAGLLSKPRRGVKLTGRELEIIRLIDREYNNRQIADTLFISKRTVETHRKHIYQKTCTNNVIGLIKYAYSHKLVD